MCIVFLKQVTIKVTTKATAQEWAAVATAKARAISKETIGGINSRFVSTQI